MANLSKVPAPHPKSLPTTRVGSAIPDDDQHVVPHAALQINSTSGAVIRAYRMCLPGGREVINVEILRPGSLKIWDPIEEAQVEVDGSGLSAAFCVALSRIGTNLGF